MIEHNRRDPEEQGLGESEPSFLAHAREHRGLRASDEVESPLMLNSTDELKPLTDAEIGGKPVDSFSFRPIAGHEKPHRRICRGHGTHYQFRAFPRFHLRHPDEVFVPARWCVI